MPISLPDASRLSVPDHGVTARAAVLAAQLVSKGGMLANVGDKSDGDKR